MKFLALFGAIRRATLMSLMALVLGLMLAGCGGGDTSTQAGVGSGGTGSYTSGPVSGFGSIIVNGIRYDDSQATVTDDEGHARMRADVKLGMTTQVRGSAVSNAQAVAQSVRYGSELLGPIDGAPGATSIAVLGQTVKVTTKTFFSDDLPAGLASLAAGNVVEVYGLPDGQGNITATRIELKAVDAASYAGSYKLRGTVGYADTNTRLCVVGAATVVYGSDAQQTPITVGALVSMRLDKAQSGSNWVATSIRSGANGVADSQQAHIEGLISKVADATHFVVNGLTVEASSAVQAAAGGTLAVGVRVEVQGAVTAGVLVASSVRVDADGGSEDIELHGTVSSLNVSTYTFIVRGTTVNYSGITPHGGTLAEGACVEVQGSQIVNGSQLQAGEIEVHDASDCH